MTASPRSQYSARVRQNLPLCREHYLLELSLPDFPETFPGQFIQIACRDLGVADWVDADADWPTGRRPRLTGREIASPMALLRRPFSLAGRSDAPDGVRLAIIHRVVGVGTAWMEALKPGDTVGILGPLGNRFALPTPDQPAFLVGGGVGIPPMLYLADILGAKKHSGAIAFCGVTTRDLLPLKLTTPADESGRPTPCIEEFARNGLLSVITTDDGSLGRRGFVTQALEDHLNHLPGHIQPILYTCGPEPMMKRVADIANSRGLDCQIAVERAMACGMGTCQSCCIKLRVSARPDGRAWLYRLACTDGPVFRASDLLW